jgi:transcriptional regulator with XRE-family HTH domain
MNDHQKLITRLRLGLALQKLLEQNKRHSTNAPSSLHQLADAAGINYSIVQNISCGKKDPQFTTLVSIAAGFNIPLAKLMEVFEGVDMNTNANVANKTNANVANKSSKDGGHVKKRECRE